MQFSCIRMISLLIFQTLKSPKRRDNPHVARHLSTSGSDSVRWTCSSGMMAIPDVDYAQQSPTLAKGFDPPCQSGTEIHCHQISRIPHQQFRVLWPHATCTLIQERYFKSVDTLGCNATRRGRSRLDTCSLLSYRQDADSIHLEHVLQVTGCTNGHCKNVLRILQQCCQSHSFNPHIKGEEDITQRDTAYQRAEEKCVNLHAAIVWYYHPTSKYLIPLVRNYEILLKFTVYEWCSSTQSSALYVQPQSWHGIICPSIKQQFNTRKTHRSFLTYLQTLFGLWLCSNVI